MLPENSFIKIINPAIKEGIVTAENVEIKFCRNDKK